MASSSQSSALSQYIEQLISTKQTVEQVDLGDLIKFIDAFLSSWKQKQGKISKSKESRKEVLSSFTSGAAEISEGISENVDKLAKKLSQTSGNDDSTAIAVLMAAGNVHWAGLSLLLVAAVLKRMDTMKKNKEECLDLLNSMNELAKVVQKLKQIPSANNAMLNQINSSIALVVQGAILCCSQKKRKCLGSFWKAQKDADDLKALGSKLDEMYSRLNSNMLVHTLSQSDQNRPIIVQNLSVSQQVLSNLENRGICKPPHVPFDQNAVGIQEWVDEVVKLLQWENDSTPSVAVVVHGIGGSGKTTLADAVYHSLTDPKPSDWKYSKIVLPQEEREYRVVKLQSKILQDLTGKKTKVTDIKEGQEKLREIMGEQSTFLYIDNALFGERLQELLPRAITNPKKLRLLVTARETNISDVMEDCMIEHVFYPIETLPIDDAIHIICRKIAPGRDTNSLLEERPEIKEIAKVLNCCPLFLEVVGGFLRRRNNEKEAYDRVSKWMQSGEPFSGHKKDRFDEGRIMFAYDQLESSAQEAFLDICSFFNWWDWDVVAQIVGEEELKCLHDGALVKRIKRSLGNGKIYNRILIHDLLLNVGRIKSIDNRFRTPEEFTRFLQRGKGELHPQVKGVLLTHRVRDLRGPFHVRAELLDEMSGSLRVFAMGNWTLVEGKCSKSFGELRFLKAEPGSDVPMDLSKLPRLTYINCGWKENIKSSEMKMPELKMADVTSWNSNEISELGCGKELRVLALRDFRGTMIPDLVNLGHLRKLDVSCSKRLLQLPESLGNLTSLKELKLSANLERLPFAFGKLKALADLDLGGCKGLKELPMDFVNLSSLQRLNLATCGSLRELPSGFEKLASLQYLNLQWCSQLISLPERLGDLTCLTEIQFRECKKLRSLPQSLGGLSSLLMSEMSFDGCSSLTELPKETSWLSKMTQLSFRGCKGIEQLWNDFHGLEALRMLIMSGCSSLSILPQGIGKLKSLKHLLLSGCDNLSKLCDDFHCLDKLEWLTLSGCRSLTKLPDCFGNLKSLETLDLSGCDKLKELCDNFHCLDELRMLNLSRCCSIAKLPNSFGELKSLRTLILSGCNKLAKLPDSFGQLGCLEEADLSGCSDLAKLSDDFQSLPSLLRLNVSNCNRLGAEWMDRVGANQSLLFVDISGSEEMNQRWMQMERQDKEWHFVVKTESFSELGARRTNHMRTSTEQWVFLLEKIMWKIFSKEGLLFDADERPFYSSSLPSHVRLVLITCIHPRPSHLEKALSNLERLEHCTSNELKIIYVGPQFNELPPDLADRIVAHSASSSWIYSVINCFEDLLPEFRGLRLVFASTIDVVEGSTIKYSSTWEDISDMNEVDFLTRNPRDGNSELLRKLCETPEKSFLLRKNEKVELKDLEGKLVLLFRKYSAIKDQIKILALEDVYLKLQTSSDYRAEVVWIPRMTGYDDFKEYLRAAARAPWPMVPNPWSVNKDNWRAVCLGGGQGLVVVDEKGRISHKDAMPMIVRWGIKAYPFSASREEELRETEWKEFKSSSQSSCEFMFQNVEHFQFKAREALRRGEMIFVCVGSISKMLELLPQLNIALEKLDEVVQVFYVWHSSGHSTRSFYDEEEEYETKRKEFFTSLCLRDAFKFWERAKCLWKELGGKGVEGRIVQMRSMVMAFLSRWSCWKDIGIVAVDENGEMVNGQAEEVVRLLCGSEGEEKHQKLMGEIKSEGFSNILRRRWRDGRIHPKHDPHHPLLTVNDRLEEGYTTYCFRCDACSVYKKRCYRCSVCEEYRMCQKCFKC